MPHLPSTLLTVRPKRSRIHIDPGPEPIVTIGPPREWFKVVGLAVFFAIWLLGGVGSLPEIIRKPPPSSAYPFLALWYLGWLSFGVLLAFATLFEVAGHRTIAISQDLVLVSWSVLSLRRCRTFQREMISDAYFEEVRNGKGLVSRAICFQYAGNKVRVVPGVAPEEANTLLAGPLRVLVRP